METREMITDGDDKMKVFCSDCKHRRREQCDNIYSILLCSKNPSPHESYSKRYYEMEKCAVKNRNNDCHDFEPSLWKRIKTFLSGNFNLKEKK